jgi:lipopolysaccharide export system permease protein
MILFSYMLRAYFKYVGGAVVLGLFLFILFDFIHKSTGTFGIHEASAASIAKYYVYQSPLQLVQILPLASLISSLVVMIAMQRSNEITVMRSAGLSIFSIASPLLLGGSLLTILAYTLNEWVVPRAAIKGQYISRVEIEKGSLQDEMDNKNHWWSVENGFYHFEGYDDSTRTLRGFRLITMHEDFTPRTLVLGEQGAFDELSKSWVFPTVREVRLTREGKIAGEQTLSFWQLSHSAIDPSQLRRDWRSPDELSLAEISPLIASNRKLGRDVLELHVAWQVKIAYPLAILLCSLMGLSFGFRSERASETLRSVIIAMTVGLGYWFVLSAFRSLGNFGTLPPVVAGWSANFLLASYVGVHLVKLHRC